MSFCIIDKSNKQAFIFWVMNVWRKETILPLIDKNGNNIVSIKGNKGFTTMVISDWFSLYKESDFNDNGHVSKE